MAIEQEKSFSKYGKSFQEKVFQSMLTDRTWAAQMIEVMDPGFFDVKYLSFLCEKYFSYFSKYKTFPTLPLLITIIKEDFSNNNDTILRDQIIEYLHRMKTNPDMGDIDYVKDKSLEFCKKQVFKEALVKSMEMIQTENYESVLSIMKNAVSSGLPSSQGHDFFQDMEARFVKINRQAIPTGLSRLDEKDILRGGLGRGEIGVITAPTGVGKSHFLVAMGANAMRAGKNVIHYTFELTETDVGLRYDSNLCNIPSNEILEHKDEVIAKYKEMGTDLGRLVIKEYPTGTATVNTLRSHIEKLMLKGFIPNIIVVDYADVMRSSRKMDSLRHELKLVYEELRNLSMDLHVPVWTASQANREAANSDVVGLENMSEAYGKAMVADIVLSLSRKPSEKALGTGRLFVAKNRAGRDGILFPINIDTSKSRFEILDDNELTLQEAIDYNKQDIKEQLKKAWNDINKKGEDE
jgi:replicative DNA helicase